jgi:hypothetical protein
MKINVTEVQYYKLYFNEKVTFSFRVFRDRELHCHLDELVSLTMYRVLHTGVQTQAIPYCNPLEPVLLDTLTGVRWLRLSSDDKVSAF